MNTEPSTRESGAPLQSLRFFAAGVPALVKAPLTLMAAFPAACAYLLSAPPPSAAAFVLFLAGTLLSGFGAAALNEWSECGADAKMNRTALRPIPAGRITPRRALAFGLALAVAGPGLLFVFFPPLAGKLAAATILIYWLVYTPLKRRTPWCTEIGAVSGALPALIGSAAAGGSITPIGWNLFLILFLWQMPHFHPIAWRYRHDYAAGGFRMLAVVDRTGKKAAGSAILYACLLVPASLIPVLLDAGPVYGLTAVLAGAFFLQRTLAFRQPAARDAAARALFRASLIYLTLLLSALLIDRWIPA